MDWALDEEAALLQAFSIALCLLCSSLDIEPREVGWILVFFAETPEELAASGSRCFWDRFPLLPLVEFLASAILRMHTKRPLLKWVEILSGPR